MPAKTRHLLFLCSRNQWRSPTAERVWRNMPGANVKVRSAGTSPKARKTVSASDIRWADFIFVMEQKHQQILKSKYDRLLAYKPLYVLDIPDEYRYMDPELVAMLKDVVASYLEE